MFPYRYILLGLIPLIFACMIVSGSNASSTGIDANTFEERFGCMRISNASSALESLSPPLPLVECLFLSKDDNSQDGIVREGCMMPLFRRYIAKQGEEFKLISSKEEFQSIFAPVETKEEALAFAVEDYFPVASSIIPTYAKENEGGYQVHLFEKEICGCGTHPYYAIDYLVTKNGNVTELSREKVYDSTMQICID
jgi:hypothetical protein